MARKPWSAEGTAQLVCIPESPESQGPQQAALPVHQNPKEPPSQSPDSHRPQGFGMSDSRWKCNFVAVCMEVTTSPKHRCGHHGSGTHIHGSSLEMAKQDQEGSLVCSQESMPPAQCYLRRSLGTCCALLSTHVLLPGSLPLLSAFSAVSDSDTFTPTPDRQSKL